MPRNTGNAPGLYPFAEQRRRGRALDGIGEPAMRREAVVWVLGILVIIVLLGVGVAVLF